MKSKRSLLNIILYLLLIPIILIIGVVLFKDRKYNIISLILAFLACLPFFIRFEKNNSSTRELVVIAVMTSLSVLGRFIFAPVPGFKPVTAIVIITAIAFGSEAGFLTGALSALVSNIYFGQGPWTPFQMFTWGLIGLISGFVYRNKEKPSTLGLVLLGVLGGIFYSLFMDIWSTIAADGVFEFNRYLALIVTSLPFMAIYAASNVIFLIILANPILEKLNRVKIKYGLFPNLNKNEG